MVLWEGTRPLLVEIQALVDHSMMGNPRRVAVGLEQNRGDPAGGAAPSRRSANGGSGCVRQCGWWGEGYGNQRGLALLLAMVSSLRDRPLPQDLVVFGEVGLAGGSARCRAVRSVSPKRQNMASAARLFRPPTCRKNSGRDAGFGVKNSQMR